VCSRLSAQLTTGITRTQLPRHKFDEEVGHLDTATGDLGPAKGDVGPALGHQGDLGPALGWLSRLQRETAELQRLAAAECRRHQLASSVLAWPATCSYPPLSSVVISHISPLLYRHLHQTTGVSDAAARHSLPRATASRTTTTSSSSSSHKAPGVIPLGAGADAPARRLGAGTDRVMMKSAAGGWSEVRRSWMPHEMAAAAAQSADSGAAGGALDLSTHRRRRRSAVDHLTPVTISLPTASKHGAERKRLDAEQWTPTGSSLMKACGVRSVSVSAQGVAVDRTAKQISCPVCGKTFNAHYNLTRHMPVHTGARPFVCKVPASTFIHARHLVNVSV